MTTKKKQDKETKYDEPVKRSDYNKDNWAFVSMIGLIVIICVCLFQYTNYQKERITGVECRLGFRGVFDDCQVDPVEWTATQPNPLDGWVEECANETIIRHYVYVEQQDTLPCDGICGGRGRASYHSIGATDIEGYVLDHIWNETHCTKKVLVKHIED